MDKRPLKVAFVHDWLVSYRGGEKTLEALCELYPEAPIFTLFYDKDSMPENINKKKLYYPKKLNLLKYFRKLFLPFLPSIIEDFDLSEYDLIISSSSCVAKGVIPAPHALHICYIHSPMRYIWDEKKSYFAGIRRIPFIHSLLNLLLSFLRNWDVTSSARVDRFLSNSRHVQNRVRRFYRRSSHVLYPPIDIKRIQNLNLLEKVPEEEFYVCLGALVPYKRVDIAIEAFNRNGKKLFVFGDGPERKKLKRLAKSNIEFRHGSSDEEVMSYLAKAKALIFPGTEDFGMTAIESFSLGTPVVAHQSGGALDFIEENVNGLFFKEKSEESLLEGLRKLDKIEIDKEKIKNTAEKFSKSGFHKKMKEHIERLFD